MRWTIVMCLWRAISDLYNLPQLIDWKSFVPEWVFACLRRWLKSPNTFFTNFTLIRFLIRVDSFMNCQYMLLFFLMYISNVLFHMICCRKLLITHLTANFFPFSWENWMCLSLSLFFLKFFRQTNFTDGIWQTRL